MQKPLLNESGGNNDFDQEMETVSPFSAPAKSKVGKRPFQISYELIFWVIFLSLTIWCIVDRFYINSFPMTVNFVPLSQSLQANKVVVSGSVIFFDGLGRASGRLFLTVVNALFWTQCKTTENFIMEHHPRFIALGDMRTVNNRIHYVVGAWFMALPMLVHVLSPFIPVMAGVPLTTGQPRAGTRVTPFIFSNNNADAEMFLAFDDLFRIAMMIFLYAFLFPFSISNFARNRWFGTAHWMHMFGAALFTIDHIRRSPHAQVFNVPVIAYFLADRLLGMMWYRTGNALVIHKEQLDEEYMAMFLYVPKQKRQRYVGSTYYLTLAGFEGAFEIAHPYVSFQNHSGQPLLPEWRNRDASSTTHKFYVDRSAGERKAFNRRNSQRLTEEQVQAMQQEEERAAEGVAAESEETVFFSNWNTAFIVQIHRWNRGDLSFTGKLAHKGVSTRLRFWGPYLSEYGELTPIGKDDIPPTVMIGTGSGCGPILDFYMFFTTNGYELPHPVTVYFSTNSVGLFQFFTDLTCAKAVPNWSVNAHLTQAQDYETDFEKEERPRDSHASSRDMKLGRLSFMDVLQGAPKESLVFFCGAPALQWKVQVACATYGLKYFPGHRFSGYGGVSCKRVGPAKFTCRCNKFPCCLVY